MGELFCEICGGNSLLKESEHFRCSDCGACYSAEHLKKMLNSQTVEMKSADSPQKINEDPKHSQRDNLEPNQKKTKDKSVIYRKTKKYASIVLFILIPLVLVAGIFELVLTQTGILARTADAKNYIESHLAHRIENENITLTSVHFTSVEATKFKTREEDVFGYFSYIEKPMKHQNADKTATEYNRLDKLKNKLGQDYDPEADTKWSYTATGTYKAQHKEQGEILGEFRFVYVCNVSANYWYFVQEEYNASPDVLRQDTKNNLTAYLLLTYDIQPNPKIEITSIEKEQDAFTHYVVHGKVVVKDQHGDEYSGNFTTTYQYTSHDHQFRELSTEVDEPTKNLWASILK